MSFIRRLYIVAILIALSISTTYASKDVADKKMLFRQINSEGGLPDNNIRELLMLDNGLMMLYSPMMLSLYDGATYMNHTFNSTFIPYKEFSTDVELVSLADGKVLIMNGDRTWYFDTKSIKFVYSDDELFHVPLGSIKSIIVGENQDIYIYLKDGSFVNYNQKTKSTTTIETPQILNGAVRMARHGHYIYIVTRAGALLRYDTLINRFTQGITNLSQSDLIEATRLNIKIASNGDIWILYDNCIQCIDPSNFKQKFLLQVPQGSGSIYTSMDIDSNDMIWVGSSRLGISIINSREYYVVKPEFEVIYNEQLSNNIAISNIYIDHKDGVWIATETEGILYHHKDIFRLSSVENSIGDNKIKGVVCSQDGKMLLGTYCGLYAYDPSDGSITMPYKELATVDCISLYRDNQNRIWLGTFRDGLYCIDNGHVRHYYYPQMPTVEESYMAAQPNFNSVRSVFQDKDDNFWISVFGGLARFDTSTGNIDLLSHEFPKISHNMFVRDIIQVDDMIFACSNSGYFTYNIAQKYLDVDSYNSDIYSKCNQAIQDKNGVVWVATSMGLVVVENGQKRTIITTNDGLVSNNIISVIEDNLSNIWAISASSVSRISVLDRGQGGEGYKFSITSFTTDDGLNIGTIYPKSVAKDSHGNIYIGGTNGFCIVDPSTLYQKVDQSCAVITNLYVNNHRIKVGEEYDGRVLLTQNINATDAIVLKHNESFISFDFSNLNYINPNHTLYRYKLENFDQDWIQINPASSGRVTYTLLKPGKYTFKVLATNNGTNWSNSHTELSITIKPPFYQTNLAYVIYFLLAIFVFVYVLYIFNQRNITKLREREQTEREEINKLKFRFFTNISHELRTPLSLILLPLNNIIRKTPKESDITPQLLTIERNASHLLSLVNHLLDFRKLEMGGETLTLANSYPVEIVNNIVSDFSAAAADKKIELRVVESMHDRSFYLDVVHINKVFNNLISNAIKFTPNGGVITITLERSTDDCLIIEVSDTGVGISVEEQKFIFDRFFQASNQKDHQTSSGIGLHIVKQYIELHKGDISIESKEGEGTTFRIVLPNLKDESMQDDEDSIIDEEFDVDFDDNDPAREKILVVEDNKDFREYLAMELKSLNYDVVTAVDGVDGVEKARATNPSIVISDIMMPNSDGFDLCNTLKGDINTSHIPIILLTARTADDVRYEGYKAGADAYLSKPFAFNILEIRIKKLIEDRQRRFEQIKQPREINSSQITINSLDEKLLNQIIEPVERNMSNADYSITQLSNDVAMHRMNLYRKIQSIAGMSPSEFLRTMRIKRAAQLMEQDQGLSIIEISEMVGFNTPKYFTNYFKKMYGVTPSQYVAQFKDGTRA